MEPTIVTGLEVHAWMRRNRETFIYEINIDNSTRIVDLYIYIYIIYNGSIQNIIRV